MILLWSVSWMFVGVSSIQSDRDYIEILKKEITDLKIHQEREKKDLELSHRSEILLLEEKFQAEKDQLQQKFKEEQVSHTVWVIILFSYWLMAVVTHRPFLSIWGTAICRTNRTILTNFKLVGN